MKIIQNQVSVLQKKVPGWYLFFKIGFITGENENYLLSPLAIIFCNPLNSILTIT